jgi:hypothetical protein
MHRRAGVLVGLLAAMLISGSATAEVQSRPRVAVLQTQVVDLGKLGKQALESTILNAIESQDAEAVPYGDPGQAHPECVTPACYADVAKATGATYVLRVDATFARSTYEVQLHLWDAASNAVDTGDRQRCLVCAADDLLKTAHDQTILLCTRRLRQPAIAAAAPPVDTQPPPPVVAPGTDLRASEPAPSLPAWRRVLPWIGIGVGVPTLAAGIALFAINNNRVCVGGEPQPCAHAYDTGTRGAVLTAVGGVLALGGGGLLLLNTRGAGDRALSISPGRLAFVGAF